MSRRQNTDRGRAGRRWVITLSVIALALVSAVLVLRRDERIDRAQATLIASGVSGIARGVVSTLGELDLHARPDWTGIRVYDREKNTWLTLEEGAPIGSYPVLLIHGLDEPGGIWDQLAPALADDGHTVVRFDYQNDQSISVSADELQVALGRLRGDGAERLDLVCHSMGGLVARDAISRDPFPELGLGIGTMVTLGTPHKGSPWARLRAVAEMREQVQRWAESDDLDPARLLGFARDGDGRAGIDLMPGSEFLKALDQRSLPAGTRVICVVGRSDQPTTLAGTLGSLSARTALRELVGEDQAGVMLDEVERLGQELGDGVVPVSSAVMDGASEIITVQANHRGMIRTIELEERVRQNMTLPPAKEPPAIEIVVERLRRD